MEGVFDVGHFDVGPNLVIVIGLIVNAALQIATLVKSHRTGSAVHGRMEEFKTLVRDDADRRAVSLCTGDVKSCPLYPKSSP